MSQKIAVIGTGYVGLVTGTCLAESGNNVLCVDIDKAKVEKMKQGIVPIYEPHLDNLFQRNIKAGRLNFTTELKEAVDFAEIIFLALPTPPGEDGSADLSYVLNVSSQIADLVNDYKIVITKSTVPVGTADKIKKIFEEKNKSFVDIVSNPEFLREGFAVDDFMKPDRIVIGTKSEKAKKILTQLYKPFVRQGNPIIFMDERSSELTKYAANAFLALKISFMNEIANLCERTGADVDMVRIGIGSDERIGKRFLFAGIGYGGSCFPKDVLALHYTASEYNYDFKILNVVMQVNQIQKSVLVQKLKKFFGSLEGKKIAVWGLAFKPDTDDVREAPAIDIIKNLLSEKAIVSAYDPEAMNNFKKIFDESKINYAKDPYDALKDADALVICTEWQLFRNPDFDKMKTLMKGKNIFDGRNIYDLQQMQELGFHYESIGRKTIN
ncbi:MAG TPA: UDP-glucose/GDP-mannose dehydrogenase family protein [Bacteroidia bacterium]|nr:UDP-glucose/GDP-mannose dehydrogenase family protein [Bacteroidia bacterium]